MYQSEVDGKRYDLGTSGFLYRSNKLMYDQGTKSLWSTMQGRPVIGPLAGKDIFLPVHYVVTTSWGEWKKRHPDTTVLSKSTGFDRDYREGMAYQQYYATDRPMFAVPELDDRLRNKDQVLVMRFGDVEQPVAIASSFLEQNTVYQGKSGQTNFVVLTDTSGANRVYESADHRFESWDQQSTATDADGKQWIVSEDSLKGPDGQVLQRLPAHRAFWFGWYAAHPETVLVK